MTTIENFENYLIFEDGGIFSIQSDRFLKPGKDTIGYLVVGLYKNKKKYTKSIHRLVGETFIPNPENKPEVDHIDRNRQNNNLSNLRWTTCSENRQNTGVQCNNKLDIKNICYHKSSNTYVFEKIINGIRHYKSFKTKEEAVAYKDEYLSSL